MIDNNKFGLKLWSINKNYFKEAAKLYDKRVYDYIELYVVPGSYEEFITIWKRLPIPFVIHAPHYGFGMNLSAKDRRKENIKLADETKKWADTLNVDYIIFHPGIGGDIREATAQLEQIYDDRILIENKPYYSIYDDRFCNGSTPEEIGFILSNIDIGFCLDIGHAIYSANGHKKDKILYIKDFLLLKPKMFHISDGEYNSIYDKHVNIGKGDFPMKDIFSLLSGGSCITIEVPKNNENDLDDFCHDVSVLKKI